MRVPAISMRTKVLSAAWTTRSTRTSRCFLASSRPLTLCLTRIRAMAFRLAASRPSTGGRRRGVSAAGVGFDISCGVRTMLTGVTLTELLLTQKSLADSLYRREFPAGVGSTGAINLDEAEMDATLIDGTRWAIERGRGIQTDLQRIEEAGQMAGAMPQYVSNRAIERPRSEMGRLG